MSENLDALRVPVKESDRRPGPYPYYGASGIVDYVDDFIFNGDHVLVAEDGENLRTRRTPVAFLVRGKFWVNNHAHVLRGNGNSDTRFLAYTISQADIGSFLTGSTMPKLTRVGLDRIPVSSPPLREQRRIAALLGALDDKIELNRRMNETLERLTRAMYSERFQNERAKDWPRTPISGLCSTQYGFTASSTRVPAGPHLLRVMDINKRPWVDWASVPYCEINDAQLDKYKLFRGDIVVARMADPGKAAIVEDEVDAVFASYLVRLKTSSRALAYFLYGFLQSPSYAEYAEGAMGGSVQKNMNARVITGADVRLPPEAEMEGHLKAIEPLRAGLLRTSTSRAP